MAKRLVLFWLSISAFLAAAAHAASVEDFYKGKTITFVVGGSAGRSQFCFGGTNTVTKKINPR